jgi:undecaprenyl-diphosphatase
LPRPEGAIIAETGYSFASGHATYAIIFFTLIVNAYRTHIKSAVGRKIFITIAVVLALLIGVSRIYLGVHYFSDVFAGFMIGGIISYLSIKIFERLDMAKK